MEYTKKNNLWSAYLIIMLLIVYSFIQNPEIAIVYLFAVFYLTYILKYSSNNFLEMIYYATLLFCLMSYSLVIPVGERYGIYFYQISLFMYYINLYRQKKKGKIQLKYYSKSVKKYYFFGIIFLLVVVSSFFWAQNKKLAFWGIVNYGSIFLIMLMIIIQNTSAKKIIKSFKMLGLIYLGILAIGTLEIAGVDFMIRTCYTDIDNIFLLAPYLKNIPVVFFYNPNNYSIIVVISMIILAIIPLKNKKTSFFLLVVYIISLINLIFARSRICWLTIIISLFFLLAISIFLKEKRLIRRVIIYSTLTILIFIGLSKVEFMAPYYGKLSSTPNLEDIQLLISGDTDSDSAIKIGGEGSSNERITILLNIFNGVVKEKNYFGFGANNTQIYISNKLNTNGIVSPHSLWFEILGDFGMVVFSYVVYIGINIIILFTKKIRNSDGQINIFNLIGLTGIFAIIFLVFAPSSVVAFTPFWIMISFIFLFVIKASGVDNSEYFNYS